MIRVQIKFPAHGVWWGASGAEAGKLAETFRSVSGGFDLRAILFASGRSRAGETTGTR